MAWSFFVWGLSEEYWDFVRWMERRTPGGRGYRLGQGLRRGIQLWLREVDGKADARGRGYRPGQGLRRGIQLRFREMAKSIAAGPELAVGSNSWPCRNNALSRNLSCITPPPQQPEPISSPSGWHFQPVGKKIKPERGRKRTRGVLSWNCRSVAVSVQRSTINTEESRDQIGTASHYKYRRIQEPDRHSVPLWIPQHTDKSQYRTTYNNEEFFPCPTGGSAREGVRASELWDRLPSHLPHWKCDRRSATSEWKKKNCIFKINFQKIQKNLNFMVDKHNSQWYYNWAVTNNCFRKTNN